MIRGIYVITQMFEDVGLLRELNPLLLREATGPPTIHHHHHHHLVLILVLAMIIANVACSKSHKCTQKGKVKQH